MIFTNLTSQLERNAKAILTLSQNISNEQARWKPDAQGWSVLEVICHLADEEVEDFRTHVDHLLYHTNDPWPEINPQAWVIERRYYEQDLNTVFSRFMTERQISLSWLNGLRNMDWERGIEAPFGKISAGDVLCSWAAHDILHLRQLVELHYAFSTKQALPYQVRYAGQW